MTISRKMAIVTLGLDEIARLTKPEPSPTQYSKLVRMEKDRFGKLKADLRGQ
jgi:hypothetical protein